MDNIDKIITAFNNGDYDLVKNLSDSMEELGDTRYYGFMGKVLWNENQPFEAFPWFVKAQEVNGDIDAVLYLARSYYLGKGVKRDYLKSYYHYQALAKEINYHPAFYRMAAIHELGQGTEVNFKEARTLYELAKKFGNSSAAVRLAYLDIKEKRMLRGFCSAMLYIPLNLIKSIISRGKSSETY